MRLAATAFAVVLLSVARLPGQTPAATNAQDAGVRDTVEFNRDIRPLLSDRCYTCHGPDQARRRTKLRFDVEADAKQDLGGRFAIVPGDAVKSEIIRRITAADPARRMPPVSSGRTLTTGLGRGQATAVAGGALVTRGDADIPIADSAPPTTTAW